INVRIIHLWKIPNFKDAMQTNTLEMILLDENSSNIQATIKHNLITRLYSLLEDELSYLIENLLDTQNDSKFKTT
ncbi:hypothetical protein CR513_07680, partial [Mucuna pruriens]